VQLFTFDLSPPLAPGEFGTLATYLAAMRSADLRFTFFDYASVWPAGESRPTYAPGSALFGGRAWLVEPEPIPEPATLALVGTGLALAAVRRRRSCRQPRVFP